MIPSLGEMKMKNWQKRSLLIIVGFCLVLMYGVVGANLALAQGGLPPRPGGLSSDSNGGPSGGGGNDNDVILGDIWGQVTDKSTGLPGAGLTVMINDIPIKTDASGRFSLTGIADGTYMVDLNLPAEFQPAQPSQTVIVANREKVNVTLGYYSLPVTPAEPAAEPETFPQTFPETGAGVQYPTALRGFTIFMLGIFVWTFGMVQILQKLP
jgi:hypothetical protein